MLSRHASPRLVVLFVPRCAVLCFIYSSLSSSSARSIGTWMFGHEGMKGSMRPSDLLPACHRSAWYVVASGCPGRLLMRLFSRHDVLYFRAATTTSVSTRHVLVFYFYFFAAAFLQCVCCLVPQSAAFIYTFWIELGPTMAESVGSAARDGGCRWTAGQLDLLQRSSRCLRQGRWSCSCCSCEMFISWHLLTDF